jgi:hypothetical protein
VAVAIQTGHGRRIGRVPGGRITEDKLAAVAGRTAPGARLAGRGRPAQHTVRAHPAQHLHRQVSQQVGQAWNVVSGVHPDGDVPVVVLPLPGVHQPLDELAHLPGGGGVVPRRQTQRVQRRGPGTATCFQRADHRIGPAGNGNVLVLAASVGVTQDPLR